MYLNVVGTSDAVEWLRRIPDNSIDSCVTDSPYGLGKAPDPFEVMAAWAIDRRDFEPTGTGFMEKAWDAFVPQPALWREVRRVVKPGGYILSFFGTRTYDWGVMAMRFAGLDVLDQLDWLYGTGFPKSLNLGKAVDALVSGGRSDSKGLKHANDVVRQGEGRQRATTQNRGILGDEAGPRVIRDEPATPEGARWQGWGTALKPAHEPIALCRVPTPNSYAENVQEHAVGALNIDASRIDSDDPVNFQFGPSKSLGSGSFKMADSTDAKRANTLWTNTKGRWPSNVLLDAAVAGEIGEVNRYFYTAKAPSKEKWFFCRACKVVGQRSEVDRHLIDKHTVVIHPTQKPVELMEYLIKLVTPPGGIVLDPFCGTGTTAVAAKRQGFNFVTCDLDPDYVKIAQTRIAAACVSADARAAIGEGSTMCPCCKSQGTITLVERATVERSLASGRKITCVTCLKRFKAEELV
jgi:DNA modification methylase